jgi:hypothetical protein
VTKKGITFRKTIKFFAKDKANKIGRKFFGSPVRDIVGLKKNKGTFKKGAYRMTIKLYNTKEKENRL